MTWKIPHLALCVFGISLFTASAFAHMLPLTDREIAAGSTDVVVAVVDGARVRWNDRHTLLFTEYTLRVEDRLRGAASQRITLSLPGGTLDGETHSTCLSTPLATGARYLLFLQNPDRPALVPITGGWQGAFREVAGPAGKRLAAAGPGEAPLRLANGEAVEFSELVRAARHLLASVLASGETSAEPAGTAAPEAASFLPEAGEERPAISEIVVNNPPAGPLVFETLPPDSPFRGADREQMSYWNLYVHDLFQVSEDPAPGWGNRNGVSEIAGFPDDAEMIQQTGRAWSPNALSLSASFTQNGHIVEVDIALNPAYDWTLDEAAATRGDRTVVSFRNAILGHLGYAWGYQGALSLGGILQGDVVSRDSVMRIKPQELDVPVLYAEDAAAARAYFPERPIRDSLISAYNVVPSPLTPFYIPVTFSASTVRAGGNVDLRGSITLENPGTAPLVNPNLEIYLVPRRFSLDRAILVKRIRLRSTLPSGEAQPVLPGRVTVPRNAKPGAYYLAFVLRDPQDAYQANNRTWGMESVKLTVRR